MVYCSEALWQKASGRWHVDACNWEIQAHKALGNCFYFPYFLRQVEGTLGEWRVQDLGKQSSAENPLKTGTLTMEV